MTPQSSAAPAHSVAPDEDLSPGPVPEDAVRQEEPELSEEVRRGTDRNHPIRRRLQAFQDWSHRGSALRRILVVGAVAVVGLVLLLAGVIMWFIPGPGWLFIFLGLGVWSLEFTWAERLNRWALRQLQRVWSWWTGTRAARWWSWCVSGAAARRAEAEEAARAQSAGLPVRSGPRNAAPGA